MYDDDDMFFVHNQTNRYTIGSTTDGLTTNDDGSLTIHIQHQRPDDAKVANWLSAPRAAPTCSMRYYSR